MEELVIEAGRTERNYWRDIWRFRELLYIFAHRDLLVRYKQTALGIAWALLRPALTMAVFVGFRRITKLSDSVVPDVLVVYAALLPWQFFSNALTESSNSLVGNSNLISKVYFPRLLIPAGAIVTSLVDFGVTFVFLIVLMAWYRFAPGWQFLLLPALTVLTFALSMGAGLLIAALNVEYRDFRYVVPFMLQFGLFVSPVAIETSRIPEKWRFIFSLNPMTGIIDAFRWSVLGGRASFDVSELYMSTCLAVLLLWCGVWYFRRTERNFADII